MPDPAKHIFRIKDLPQRKATRFDVQPTPSDLAQIAASLDLLELRKLRFTGEIAPLGQSDWRLTAKLGATITQPCGITLAPVVTRIDDPVSRRYAADFGSPEGSEVEMPQDDTVDPLPDTLDVLSVAVEALSLALPVFPRAKGAVLGDIAVTEPGKTPMSDEAAKPFAGLAKLRSTLTDTPDPTGPEKDE